MDYLEYKGYRGSIEYSLADKCFVGQVQGLGKKVLILYEGNTIDELRKDFEEGVDSYLEGCKAGTTINEFINRAIRHELEHECAL